MGVEHLPLYKTSLALAIYMEQIVRAFEKYHKYSIGIDLRNKSKSVLFLLSHASVTVNKSEVVLALRNTCEEMKMLIHLAKELKAFRSFKQFEYSSLLAVSICKQAQAWLKSLEVP